MHTSGREIPRWAGDLAEAFLMAGDLPHAEEWARRGLTVPGGPRAPGGDAHQGERLFETLSTTLMQERKFQDVEQVARRWMASFPGEPLAHVFRAMAVESLSRPGEALEEYRRALPMTEKEDARRFLETAIARLENRTPRAGGAEESEKVAVFEGDRRRQRRRPSPSNRDRIRSTTSAHTAGHAWPIASLIASTRSSGTSFSRHVTPPLSRLCSTGIRRSIA